jgi:hypothetical protein
VYCLPTNPGHRRGVTSFNVGAALSRYHRRGVTSFNVGAAVSNLPLKLSEPWG